MGEVVRFPTQLRVLSERHGICPSASDIRYLPHEHRYVACPPECDIYLCAAEDSFEEAIANEHFKLEGATSSMHPSAWLYMFHYNGHAYFRSIDADLYVSFPSKLGPHDGDAA